MKLISPVFNNREQIPAEYSCEGANISPPLIFENVNKNAKSLVLTVEDTDPNLKKPWVHWLVFNIPPDAIGFEENQVAENSIEGLCNGNTFGYDGPCPADGKHEYIFTLYSLDTMLDIPAESDIVKVKEEMKGHIIEEAFLTGFYQSKIKAKIA